MALSIQNQIKKQNSWIHNRWFTFSAALFTVQLSRKSNLFLLILREAVFHEAENLKYYVIEIKTTFKIPCSTNLHSNSSFEEVWYGLLFFLDTCGERVRAHQTNKIKIQVRLGSREYYIARRVQCIWLVHLGFVIFHLSSRSSGTERKI